MIIKKSKEKNIRKEKTSISLFIAFEINLQNWLYTSHKLCDQI